MMNYSAFDLESLFEIEKGKSKYTHKYSKINTGIYPVYSSKTEEEGEIFKINTFDYDENNYGRCLTWTTDGIYAGTLFIRECKFSLTSHCGALFLKDKYKRNIDIEYCYYYLKDILSKYAIGEDNKRLTKGMIGKIHIKIPVDNNGIADLNKQKELVVKYKKIDEMKKNISLLEKRIKDLYIDYNLDRYSFKYINMNELLEYGSGNSKLDLKYLNSNKGRYPVFSSQTANNGIMGYLSTYDFDCECVQITTNGANAGTIFYREKQKFSINGDARIYTLKKGIYDVDYRYLTIELMKQFKKNGFSWSNKPSITRTRKIIIGIPVDNQGNFDICAQKEIIKINEVVENIKKEVVRNLKQIQSIKVI